MVKVKFLNDKLEKEYLSLLDDDRLKKKINWVIERIKENPNFGQPIAKRLIPKEYKNERINNAFWIALSDESRLIYTIISEDKDEITATIVEWFVRHKDYERKFSY